jgi:hypothetical protein
MVCYRPELLCKSGFAWWCFAHAPLGPHAFMSHHWLCVHHILPVQSNPFTCRVTPPLLPFFTVSPNLRIGTITAASFS